jgi:hypothetical protein
MGSVTPRPEGANTALYQLSLQFFVQYLFLFLATVILPITIVLLPRELRGMKGVNEIPAVAVFFYLISLYQKSPPIIRLGAFTDAVHSF